MNRPEISPTAAMEQAGTTVSVYLSQSCEAIHKLTGESYAEVIANHPELLGQMIRAQAVDFDTYCRAYFAPEKERP